MMRHGESKTAGQISSDRRARAPISWLVAGVRFGFTKRRMDICRTAAAAAAADPLSWSTLFFLLLI